MTGFVLTLIGGFCCADRCRRKCCAGGCSACTEVCGRKLNCNNHKCEATCHPGACIRCPKTAQVSCACGVTTITVPCGAEREVEPPKCSLRCQIKVIQPIISHHFCIFIDSLFRSARSRRAITRGKSPNLIAATLGPVRRANLFVTSRCIPTLIRQHSAPIDALCRAIQWIPIPIERRQRMRLCFCVCN